MNPRYGKLAGATLIVGSLPWGWSAVASYIYLLNMGFVDAWEFPWLQIWHEAADVTSNGLPRGMDGVKVIGSLLMALAIPSLGVGLLVRLATRRWRSRLTYPLLGGVRPTLRGPTDNYGNAVILSDKECMRRFPGPDGIPLGELRSGPPGTTPLVIDPVTGGDAGNGAFIAGVGSGKSQSLATQLMYWPGSSVVLDAKVELGHMVADALRSEGKTVYVMDIKNPKGGFNVIGWLNPNAALASLDIKSVISWIFPDDKEDVTGSNKDPYFEPSGRSVAAAILADLVWSDAPAQTKTLATFRQRIVTPEDQMKKALAAIAKSSKSALARDLASTLCKITEKQWSGVYGQATQGTEWLSDPDLAAYVSGDSFKAEDILDGNTAIFVQIPLKTLIQAPGVGRVIIGSLLNAVYEAEGKITRRVGFFLDEAWSLGRMQIQRTALVTGRSFGVTLIWYYQSTGQIKDIWGESGVATFYNNLTWRAYAAVKDRKTAEEVSEAFGEMSVISLSEGSNRGVQRPPGFGWGSRSSGTTSNRSEIKRRILLPQEIATADPSDLFVIAGDVNMRLRAPRAYLRQELRGIVKPSPHYRKSAGQNDLIISGS